MENKEIIEGSVLVSYSGSDKEYTVPSSVKTIKKAAFEYATQLETLIIPDNVTTLEENLFFMYKVTSNRKPKLKSVVIGDGVKIIPKYAFYGCKKLKNITFGKNVEVIEEDAFYNCKMKKLVIPKTVKTVGVDAFGDVKELVVYDSIDPDLVSADEWKNNSQNSSLAQAVIDNDEYIYTVLSSVDDTVKYKLYIKNEFDYKEYEFFHFLISAYGKNASFKFDEYDEWFKKLRDKGLKLKMAYYRVQYPYQLTESHKKSYINFLKRCLYFESSIIDIMETIVENDDINMLLFVKQYAVITDEGLEHIKKIVNQLNAQKCIKEIEKWNKEEI